jgi:hypothetical protein
LQGHIAIPRQKTGECRPLGGSDPNEHTLIVLIASIGPFDAHLELSGIQA